MRLAKLEEPADAENKDGPKLATTPKGTVHVLHDNTPVYVPAPTGNASTDKATDN